MLSVWKLNVEMRAMRPELNQSEFTVEAWVYPNSLGNYWFINVLVVLMGPKGSTNKKLGQIDSTLFASYRNS